MRHGHGQILPPALPVPKDKGRSIQANGVPRRPLWVTCGRRPGKNFLTACSIGRVRSRVPPVGAAGMAAGPNALRGTGPKQKGALGSAMTQAGSPVPRNDRICIRRHALANWWCRLARCLRGQQQLRLPVPFAAGHDGPRHPGDLVGQGNGSHLGRPARHQPPQPRVLLRTVLLRIADDGHGTGDRSHRKYRLPCFVMLPSLSLPPVVCCFGTSPIQAARPRPDLNAFQSPISATSAVATIGRTRNLLQPPAWLASAMPARMLLPIEAISAPMALYCAARTLRMLWAAKGIRLSASFVMISSNSPVPLRPLADTIPSSARCPRMALLNMVR